MWPITTRKSVTPRVRIAPLLIYSVLSERNHQGKQNRLLFPLPNRGASGENGIVRCKERLGGLLKYYEREAA